MLMVDLSKCDNRIEVGLRKFKRLLDRMGVRRARAVDTRHVGKSEKRRKDKMAADKRYAKQLAQTTAQKIITPRKKLIDSIKTESNSSETAAK